MHDVNVVPGCERRGDALVSRLVCFFEVSERLPGKNDAPTKGVVRAVPFVDVYVMRSVCALHQDGKVKSRRPAPNDVDLHKVSSMTFLRRSLMPRIPAHFSRYSKSRFPC